MPNLWLRLVDLWRGAGLVIRPPATVEAIRAFESQYGVIIPADMREYFLTVDGMEDELDPGLNRFWPLSMVKPVEQELSAQLGCHSLPVCPADYAAVELRFSED